MKRTLLLLILILCASLANATTQGTQLTATIIGSGSPIYNEERAGPSVLISNGETQILVDMGNGTQANLSRDEVDVSAISALLFTHHHLDHNEEFVPIFIRSLLGRHDFQIIGPPNTDKFVESTLELYSEDIAYRLGRSGRDLDDRKDAFTVKEVKGGETFHIGGIKVSTLEVPHTIYTVAYRFDYRGESIVVTGDLTYSEKLPGFAEGADFMIIDSGGMIMKNSPAKNKKPGGHKDVKGKEAHLDLSQSSLLAKKAGVKTLVYTHFLPGEVNEKKSLEEIRKNYNGNVIFGKDLMVLNNAKTTLSRPIADTDQEPLYNDRCE